MAIKFRHDAAAVALPSNQSQRKYGQSLVLQQNQQKYAAQQQGYDRLFTLGRDAMQSRDQAIRQGQQNAFQTIRDVNQNANLMERQESQNKFLLDQQQKAQQQAFLDEARKQSSGMIMEDIKNEQYDPATARKLQQNLVAESEALGNPGLDATQRAEALQKIRAERAVLTANRMQKPPPPTPDEEFKQGVATDPETGMRYRKNSKGDWEELKQAEKPPTSAIEAFKADPKTEAKFMEEAKTIITEGGEKPLDEAGYGRAVSLARKLWERSNTPSEFGGRGSTSSAGYYNAPDSGTRQAPPAAAQAPAGIPVAPPDPGQPPSPPMPGGQQSAAPPLSGAEAAYHEDMTAKGYILITPPDGSRPYYYLNSNTMAPAATPQQPQNPWSEVASAGDAQPSQSPAAPTTPVPQAGATQTIPDSNSPPNAAPDFKSLVANAEDDLDREVFGKLQGIYTTAKPEVQTAIGVLVNPGSTKREKAEAAIYLRDAGIDLENLAKTQTATDRLNEYQNNLNTTMR